MVRIQRKYFYTQYEVKVQVFNDMCDHMVCSGPTSLPVTIYSAEDLPQVAPTQVGARPFNSTGILKSNALSFYRSQNVLGWSKCFVPDQKYIYILWQLQTFCARQKDDLHSVKLIFVPAQKFLKRH